MNPIWSEIQPVDAYAVSYNGVLHDFDQRILTMLYQPLIGSQCFSLYMTLWSVVKDHTLSSEEWTHYHLMSFLSMNLSDIYEARRKLEAIGLLNTYVKQEEVNRQFIYELQPPLSPEQFFTDGMLNIYLYRQVGGAHFQRLRAYFVSATLEKGDTYKDVTARFQEVFSSQHANFSAEAIDATKLNNGEQYFYRSEPKEIEISQANFDFDLLYAGLSDVLITRSAFTKEVKSAIAKLAFLYHINAIDMKSIVLDSLNEEQEIDIKALRKAARNWNQIENKDLLPQLVDRVQPEVHRSAPSADSQEAEMIRYLEEVSPRQLIIDLNDGAEPASSEIKAIEDVLFQQKLPEGVMNVLIHYIMLRTDMKLSKNYMEKIASHWRRKKVSTVKEALEIAKGEHRQYQQWATDKQSKQSGRTTAVRKEKLPEWFQNKKSGDNETKKTNQTEDDIDVEELRRKLLEDQNNL